MNKNKTKVIIALEGLSGAGKSVTIRGLLKHDYFQNKNKLFQYGEFEPIDISILKNHFDKYQLKNAHYFVTATKIVRYGIWINDIIHKSEEEFIIFDRGLLNIFIDAVAKGIPKSVIKPFIDNLYENVIPFNYTTILLQSDINIANDNIRKRIDRFRINHPNATLIDIEKQKQYADHKLRRNFEHHPVIKSIEELDFQGTIIKMDASIKLDTRVNMIIDIIRKLRIQH